MIAGNTNNVVVFIIPKPLTNCVPNSANNSVTLRLITDDLKIVASEYAITL